MGRFGWECPDLEVIEEPSIREAGDRVWDGFASEEIDGVICSATELNGITRVFSDYADEIDFGERRGLFYVEFGFPNQHYHAIVPQPFLGYGGAVALAQRIFTAPRLLDLGRLKS
jgi:nitrogenase molybdenum-iron protein alpha/beta subunit